MFVQEMNMPSLITIKYYLTEVNIKYYSTYLYDMEWILVGGPVCACRLYKSDQFPRNLQKNTIYGILAYVI